MAEVQANVKGGFASADGGERMGMTSRRAWSSWRGKERINKRASGPLALTASITTTTSALNGAMTSASAQVAAFPNDARPRQAVASYR